MTTNRNPDTNQRKILFERKEKLVIKEFDTGFSNYQKLEGKVANLRQWTITLNVAFVLYTLERCNTILPVLIVVSLFMIIILVHELRERASMKFDKQNILLIEQMFDTTEQENYENKIINYKFRDEVISKLDAKTKLKHYWSSIHKGEVIVWYGMWLVVWTILILIKRWTTIFTTNHTINQILFILVFVLVSISGILIILKYFRLKWLISWWFNEIKLFFKKIFKFKKLRKIKYFTFKN
jgi:hypothetical protein